MVENYRTVLSTYVWALPIQRCRIVVRPEHIQKLLVADLGRIVFYLDHLRVTGLVRAHIVVGRILFYASRVPDRSRHHAFEIAERFFHTPKAPGTKHGFFCLHDARWNDRLVCATEGGRN